MQAKKIWLTNHDNLLGILTGLELPTAVSEVLQRACSQINEFEMIIPIVGGFNAGKTSLLNALLNIDYLPVDILPVTTIATEIRQGDSAKIIAWKKNGETDEFSVSDIHSISNKIYDYVVLYVNSSFFSKHHNIVLVDMPGIDSGLEAHNNALLNYLPKAQAVITLTDIEHGTIKQSVYNTLESFSYFGSRISVLVSKADLKPETDRAAIIDNIQQQLRKRTNENLFVGCISTLENELSDAYTALEQFNPNQRLAEIATTALLDAAGTAKRWLKRVIVLTDTDTKQIDQIISELENQKEEYALTLNEEVGKLRRRFSNEIPERILGQVREALECNVPMFVDAAKVGADALAQVISDVTRTELLVALNQYVGEAFQDSSHTISENISGKLKLSSVDFKSFLGEDIDMSKALGDLLNIFSKHADFGGILKAVAKSVNSILSFILALLPALGRLLQGLFGPSVEQKFRDSVIPQILANIRPELITNLKGLVDRYSEEVHKSLHGQIAQLEASLETQNNQKRVTIQQAEETKQDLELRLQRIAQFEDNLERITTTATKVM